MVYSADRPESWPRPFVQFQLFLARRQAGRPYITEFVVQSLQGYIDRVGRGRVGEKWGTLENYYKLLFFLFHSITSYLVVCPLNDNKIHHRISTNDSFLGSLADPTYITEFVVQSLQGYIDRVGLVERNGGLGRYTTSCFSSCFILSPPIL